MKHLTKQILSMLAVICLLAGVSGVFFMDAHASTDWMNSSLDGGMQRLYGRINEVYGSEAVDLYKKAVLTGDYYYYRQHVGCWKPVCQDTKVMGKIEGCISQPALIWEQAAHSFMGKYATVQDFLDRLAETGYTVDNYTDNPVVSYPALKKNLSQPTHKALATLPYRTWVDGVYNIGDANPYASASAAPASTTNTAAAESLKSYKGNTAEFNAYYYYVNYADLQNAFGTNGDLLKQHYTQYGKVEGRIANKLK